MKAIRQIYGSGVYVIANEISDVTIKGDTLFLGKDSSISMESGDIASINCMIYSKEKACLTDNRNVRFKESPNGLKIFNWLGDFMMGENVSVDKAIEMLSIDK